MMRHRKTNGWVAGVVGIACAATLLAFGGGPAVAAPGDSFYVSKKKNTFVSFVVRAGSGEVSELAYGARKMKCDNGLINKGGMAKLFGTAPIEENLVGEQVFDDFWAQGHPSYGGIAGTFRGAGVKGELDLRISTKKRPGCESGLRKWNAKPVSEEEWKAAREKAGYPLVDHPAAAS